MSKVTSTGLFRDYKLTSFIIGITITILEKLFYYERLLSILFFLSITQSWFYEYKIVKFFGWSSKGQIKKNIFSPYLPEYDHLVVACPMNYVL